MFMAWGVTLDTANINCRDRICGVGGVSPWRLCTCNPRYRTWERYHPGDCRNVTPHAGSGAVTLETV